MKKIAGTIYTHMTQRNQLAGDALEMAQKAEQIFRKKMGMKAFLNIEIIKVDVKQKTVSFIESPDWDTAREPEVGTSYMIKLDDTPDKKKEIKITKGRGQIYHHKWMFVADNYKGFDVEESKRWSDMWQATLPSTRAVKSRIGYKKYWNEILKENNLEVQ